MLRPRLELNCEYRLLRLPCLQVVSLSSEGKAISPDLSSVPWLSKQASSCPRRARARILNVPPTHTHTPMQVEDTANSMTSNMCIMENTLSTVRRGASLAHACHALICTRPPYPTLHPLAGLRCVRLRQREPRPARGARFVAAHAVVHGLADRGELPRCGGELEGGAGRPPRRGAVEDVCTRAPLFKFNNLNIQ